MDDAATIEHVLRIACPKWAEDGVWPPPWDHPCTHLRLEISLPLDIARFSALCNAIGACSCGQPMVILCHGRPDDPAT
jgi:hypothetical protein